MMNVTERLIERALKPETKKAAKAREIAEKIAEKAAQKAKRQAETFSHPIAVAVEPLRKAAISQAEKMALDHVAKVQSILEKHAFNLNEAAPRLEHPSRRNNILKKDYEAAESRYYTLKRLTKGPKRPYGDKSPEVVEMCEEEIVRYVHTQKEIAALEYESFVYKLVDKLKAHVPAPVAVAALRNEDLEDDHLWNLSILTVTREDGAVERWKTRNIWNVSVLGKVFPQWPTRLMKD